MAKRSLINCCVSGVPPAPVYKGARGRGGRPGEGRARRSSTPTGSRTPSLFLVGLGVEGKEEGERKERGAQACPSLLSSLPPRPTKAHSVTGGFR